MRAVLCAAAIFQTKLPTKFHKTSAKHRILEYLSKSHNHKTCCKVKKKEIKEKIRFPRKFVFAFVEGGDLDKKCKRATLGCQVAHRLLTMKHLKN